VLHPELQFQEGRYRDYSFVLEMKAQEIGSDKIFKETGDIAGLDFTLNRAEKCGRMSPKQ